MSSAVAPQKENPITELTLRPGMLHIGRAEDNDLVINEHDVSDYHAKIVTYFHESVLIDLVSEKGSFINNKRIIKHTLKDGDIVQLGDYIFKVRIKTESFLATQ